jgi:bifunctional DNase/RNase
MKKELTISAIVQTNGPHYVLLMQEVDGERRIPIVIGASEAQSIIMVLENYPLVRPLTHDLFVNTLSAFGIVINEIVIVKVQDNIFYSELVCEQVSTGTRIRIDSRTSDAIALAIRFKCKIYAEEKVLQEASISLNLGEEASGKVNIEEKIAQLEKKLNDAVAEEKYEEASFLRDEIKKLKEQLKKRKKGKG